MTLRVRWGIIVRDMRREDYIKCLVVAALFAAIIGYSVFSDGPKTDAEPPRPPVWLEEEP